MQRGAVYSEPLAMSNRDYNPFREEYIDPTAPDPNVDFTGFDVPYSDDAQHVSDAATAVAAAGRSGALRPRPFPCGIRPDGGFDLPASVTSAAADEEFEEIASGSDPDPAAEESGAGAFAFGGDGADGADGGPADAEFGGSTLDFIPSEADAEQQRLDVEPHAEFSDAAAAAAAGMSPHCSAGASSSWMCGGPASGCSTRSICGCWDTARPSASSCFFPSGSNSLARSTPCVEEHAVEFAALGFDIDLCGGGVVEVKGTPADLPADSVDTTALRAVAGLCDARVARRRAARDALLPPWPVRPCAVRSGCSRARRPRRCWHGLPRAATSAFRPRERPLLIEITTEELRGRLG